MNLLVRLGRRVLAGPIAGSGLLPAAYYRHLALGALEAEDFPGGLHLKWAETPCWPRSWYCASGCWRLGTAGNASSPGTAGGK